MPISDLTPEEAARAARHVTPEPPPERSPGALDYVSAFNRGVAESAPGAPGVLRSAGFSIKSPEEDQQNPPTIGEGAARMAGTGVGIGAQMLAAPEDSALRLGTAAYSAGSEVGGMAARGMEMLRGFINDYKNGAETARLAKEVSSNAAVGAAGAAAYQGTQDPNAQAAAELGASFLGPTAAAYSKYGPVGWATRKLIELRKIPSDVTLPEQLKSYPAKAVLKAADQLSPLVERGGVVPKDIPPELAGQMTTAEQSQNPDLMSLQRAVLRGQPGLAAENANRTATINDVIKSGIDKVAVGPNGELSPDVARAHLNDVVEGRINEAKANLETRLNKVGSGRTADVASADAVKIAQGAEADAAKLEDALWRKPDQTVPTPISKTAEQLKTIEADQADNRVLALRQDLPPDVSQMLDTLLTGPKPKPGSIEATGNAKVDAIKARIAKLNVTPSGEPKTPTFGEVKDLRSTILGYIRAEQAKRITGSANERMIRNLGGLQDALLQDMSASANGPDAEIARNFSADMKKRFEQTDIADWINKRRTGEANIPPTLALKTSVGRNGERGALSFDQLKDAVTPRNENLIKGPSAAPAEMQGAVQDYLSSDFLKATTVQGGFSPTAARSWLSRNAQILARNPDLKQRLIEATASGDLLKIRTAMQDDVGAAASLVLKSKFGSELTNIVNSPNPLARAREVKRALLTDKSGAAMESAQQSLIDSLMKPAQAGGVLSGEKLLEQLDRPAVRQVMGEFLTPKQRTRLRMLANAGQVMEKARTGPISDAALNVSKQNPLINFIQRVVGAKMASELNRMSPVKGGGIQVASEGSKLATSMAEKSLDASRKLIRDAVLSKDPALLNAILLYKSGNKMPPAAKTWLISTLAQYGVQKNQPGDAIENP